MHAQSTRLLGGAGVLAGALFATALAATGGAPEEAVPAGPVIDHYRDAESTYAWLGIGVGPVLALLLVAFGVALRSRLRSREAGEASWSALAFGGAVAAAMITGIVAGIGLAAARAAGDGALESVLTLHRLGDYMWVPWVAAFSAITLGAGIGGLRTTALPAWLAWPSLVIGVVFLTPAGFVPFLLMPVWLVVTGAVLVLGTRADAVPAAARPATA
jgi:hypothetical protein